MVTGGFEELCFQHPTLVFREIQASVWDCTYSNQFVFLETLIAEFLRSVNACLISFDFS